MFSALVSSDSEHEETLQRVVPEQEVVSEAVHPEQMISLSQMLKMRETAPKDEEPEFILPRAAHRSDIKKLRGEKVRVQVEVLSGTLKGQRLKMLE